MAMSISFINEEVSLGKSEKNYGQKIIFLNLNMGILKHRFLLFRDLYRDKNVK